MSPFQYVHKTCGSWGGGQANILPQASKHHLAHQGGDRGLGQYCTLL